MNIATPIDSRCELLIGCGNSRFKKLSGEWTTNDWAKLTTLDMDPETKPDVVHDLDVLPYPFADNSFDEIHAYDVLEHCGRQGDWRFFFGQFYEFWRILKPGGFMAAMVPAWTSPWAWGDPGHTRIITRQTLIFLDRREYVQLGQTAMTDYRGIWKGDFEVVLSAEEQAFYAFVLQAKK